MVVEKIKLIICDEQRDALKIIDFKEATIVAIPNVGDEIVHSGRGCKVINKSFLFTKHLNLLEVSINIQ